MDDLIDLIDISQTLVFPWQQTSELAEPKKLLFTCKGWSLQVIITLWLFEFCGYHNQAIYYSYWWRQKPDNAKSVRAVLITAKLRKSLEGFQIFQANCVYYNTLCMEDVFGSFWSVKTWAWRDEREVEYQGNRTWCDIRDGQILACIEYVLFNQKMRVKFEIEGRDAGWKTANHGYSVTREINLSFGSSWKHQWAK